MRPTSARSEPLEPGFVRLEASVRPVAGAAELARVVRGDPSRWFGDAQARGVVAGFRRYAVDLRLAAGGDGRVRTTFRKAALLDLGPVRRTASGYELEIGWRAATAAPLFPVFSGRLRIGGSDLRIEGIYAPPGGVVGRIADRVLLHTAAHATARWLLRELDRAAASRSPGNPALSSPAARRDDASRRRLPPVSGAEG